MYEPFEKKLAKKKNWYPPRCKTDLVLLAYTCSFRGIRERSPVDLQDMRISNDTRSCLRVLTDVDYSVVHPEISGDVMGFSFDRRKPTTNFKLTVSNPDRHESVSVSGIVKFERTGDIPYRYQTE